VTLDQQKPSVVQRRLRDPERTKEEILVVSTQEFASVALPGRVDEIANQTRTTKRMIYYYFGSKERLYTAALQRAYETFVSWSPTSRLNTSTRSRPFASSRS